MSRGKQGKKMGRAAANRDHQTKLRERKRLRAQRRHERGVLTLRETEKAKGAFQALIDQGSLTPLSTNREQATPSVEQWADMLAQAKKRKRSIVKVAEKAGWTRIGLMSDGKSRHDWSVS
jgi:hypothetical protein